MKKYVYMILAVLALVPGAFAQTTNPRYEVTLFGAPPPGQDIWGRPRWVAADGKGTIIVIRPSGPPIAPAEQSSVLIFNRAGELQKTWGDGLFPNAHSVDFDDEGNLWITDRGIHMVYKYTMDGRQLMAPGKKGMAGDNKSTDAFNGPTDVAVTRNGDFFVSDGQADGGDGNSRVVHFSKDGKFIKIIGGTKGSGPGQFDTPHALAIDSRGRLLVLEWQSESGNPRVQVLDQNGEFIEQWANIGLGRPTGIAIAADDTVYIGDTDANAIFVLKDGEVIDVIGGLQARPHSVALDPQTGVLYFVDPPTALPQGQGGGSSQNVRVEGQYGGFVKTVVKKE